MKKAKNHVLHYAGKLLITLSVLLFLCASGNAQYATQANYWSSFGLSYTQISPYQGYAGYTKTDPFSTIPSSITKDNSSSTGSRSGSSTSSSGLNQDSYIFSGWVDTMTWYMQALDLYGWKPENMIGGYTSSTCYACLGGNTLTTCGFNCGSSSITSSTCTACISHTFATCFACQPKIKLKDPSEIFGNYTDLTCSNCEVTTRVTCGYHCGGGQTMVTCGPNCGGGQTLLICGEQTNSSCGAGYSACGISITPYPYSSSNYSYSSSNVPSQPPAW